MAGVNKAILVGNLGRDPELRQTPSGQSVCNFTLATSETWNDRNGERVERTEWHRIVAWGKTGELCAQYLSKGRTVYVEGRIQTREWEDKEGNKRYTTEINAQNVNFIGPRGSGSGSGGTGEDSSSGGRTGSSASYGGKDHGGNDSHSTEPTPPLDDDIPF